MYFLLIFLTFILIPNKLLSFKGIDSFEYSITSTKDYFIEGEDIWIEVKIKNEGANIDSIIFDSEDYVEKQLVIFDTQKTKLAFENESDNIKPELIYLQPNESTVFYINLSQPFGSRRGLSASLIPEYLNGIYTISYNRNAIVLDETIIEVRKPSHNESNELQELKDIYKMPPRDKENRLKKLQAFKNFLTKYPNSIYWEQAFYEYALLQYASDTYLNNEEALLESLIFLRNYPNSFYINTILQYGLKAAKLSGDDTKEKEFLIIPMTTYKYTRAGQEAVKIYSKRKF